MVKVISYLKGKDLGFGAQLGLLNKCSTKGSHKNRIINV